MQDLHQPLKADTEYFDATAAILELGQRLTELERLVAIVGENQARLTGMLIGLKQAGEEMQAKPVIVGLDGDRIN